MAIVGLSKWCKTMQRSQRSAGGDSGSVGRPLRHILSGCRMTAQAQLVLDARAATGRSVQVIKPFMHSSTHPQAFYINSLCKVTPVHHCTPIALILLSCTPLIRLSSGIFFHSVFFLFPLITLKLLTRPLFKIAYSLELKGDLSHLVRTLINIKHSPTYSYHPS